MADVHELECPEHIGREAGSGKSASMDRNKIPPLLCGGTVFVIVFEF